jgi:hypothetical protein
MAPMACSFAEPLMIDFTCDPATQNPSSPRMVWTTTMVVVTAATDGELLSPLRASAMRGPNVQNGTNHRRMSNTPTRRRSGDMPADFTSSVDDPSPMQIPRSTKGGRARALALHGGSATQLPREYGHLWLVTACRTVVNLGARLQPTCVPTSVIARTLLGPGSSPHDPYRTTLDAGRELRICECVVTAVLGGLPPGSGPVVSGDSLRIWPRKRVPFV